MNTATFHQPAPRPQTRPVPSDLANDARAALQRRKPILRRCWFTSSQDGQSYEVQVTHDGELNIYDRATERHITSAPILEIPDFVGKFA